MPIKRGQEIPKPIGYIRTVCNGCMASLENAQTSNAKRQHFELIAQGRLNCNYCEREAHWLSVPKNLSIIDNS